MPVDALVDDVPLYDLEPEEPAEPLYPDPPRAARSGGVAGARRCSRCSPRRTSRRSGSCSSSTTRSSARARCAGPSRPTPRCSCSSRTAAAARSRSSIDGNGRRVACDPYTGAVEAVLECARNLACVGAEPLGLTNCLNFGNPEKPHIAWQLTRAVEGIRDACLALGVPVVGGNVSLYNEGGEGPIYPTPIIGMVGKLPEPAAVPRPASRRRATRSRSWGCSSRRSTGRSSRSCAAGSASSLPPLDLAAHADALVRVRAAVRGGELPTAHDISEGGLACALAECCIAGGIGARVTHRGRAEARRCSARARAASSWPGPREVDRGARRRDRHRRGGRRRARDRRRAQRAGRASCGRRMRTRSRRRSPGSAGDSPRSAGPWALALRRLRRDRAALAFGALFAADRARAARRAAVRERGGRTPRRRRTTSPTQTVVDGKPTDVVSLDGVPIGPTWQRRVLPRRRRERPRPDGPAALRRARLAHRSGLGAVLLSLLLGDPARRSLPATAAAAPTRSSAGCSTCSGRSRRCSSASS